MNSIGTAAREPGPLVSVAIPVYNGQAVLAQTLQSLLTQTHRPLEIIVVDDGSTDGSWQVLESFGDRIRAIRQPNGGIASARNTGVQAARGEFIALMDHDDLCEPERIAVQLRFLQQQPDVVLCCSDFSAFDAHGPVSASHSATYYSRCSPAEGGVMARYPSHGSLDIGPCLPEPPAQPIVVPTCFGAIYDELALGNFVHPPTVMFRRSVLQQAGLFEQGARTMVDWDWLVKVAHVGAIGFIDRPLLRYRLSATQISSSDRAQTDSLLVAQRICQRDPSLWQRHPQRLRQLLGQMHADAADARADRHRLQALWLLATGIVRYRIVTRQTPRTLLKILTPTPLLRLLRSQRRGKRQTA